MEQEEICIDVDSGPLCELDPWDLDFFTVRIGSKVHKSWGPPRFEDIERLGYDYGREH